MVLLEAIKSRLYFCHVFDRFLKMQVCHKHCPAACGYQVQNLKIQLGLPLSIIKPLISFLYFLNSAQRGSTCDPPIIAISVSFFKFFVTLYLNLRGKMYIEGY